ncbi:MAG: transglycosylase SLT domain-containing protein [Gemmatimonadales bacterium]
MSSNEIQVTSSTSPEVRRFTETVRIGRAATNAVVLDHEQVSAEHLELHREGRTWELVDLGSEHGTFVNGERVTRVPIRGLLTVRLGPAGPELRLAIPRLSTKGWTPLTFATDIAGRYFSDEDPENMSSRTAMIRAAFRAHHDQTTQTWRQRLRSMRVVVGVSVLVAAVAGTAAVWQARRVRALRATAGEIFNTMKSLELDIRRIEANAGPDQTVQERRARLEAQYNDLIKTLGIYSDRTPADVRLIYRTIHRLGESEATVPGGFIKEVQRTIRQWRKADIETAFARAEANALGPIVTDVFRRHHLPREFFFVALQESKFDPRAIGPSGRFGVPKGLWQMIPSTAEAYGLRMGPLQGDRTYDPLDERHDPAKATEAAARYLEDIYSADAQASGLLVLASYNMGETRLRGLLRSLPESPAERNWWSLLARHRAAVPQETYDYVLRILAAAVIGEQPDLFGFEAAPPFPAETATGQGS